MQQLYQDSMAIVRKYGKPDLFITFTCNPKWPEILTNLEKHQTPQDRPDIVTRVFKLKLNSLIKDIKQNHIFGIPVASVYVIEFQKRGLPHAHILIILQDRDKIRDIAKIDDLICAELPDPVINKKLYDIVTSQLLHGPCGQDDPTCVCMVDGKCSKDFPKEYINETNPNINGYPLYRRRNSSIFFEKTVKGRKVKVIQI